MGSASFVEKKRNKILNIIILNTSKMNCKKYNWNFGHSSVQKENRVVSSTLWIVQILVHLNFDMISWLLALEATELISEPVTQMAPELINNHLISVQQKR